MEAESSSVEEGPREPRPLVSDLLTGFSQLNIQRKLKKTKKIASLRQVNQQLMLEQCDPKASFLKYYLHVMNTGDEVALQELQGIGEKIATRILEVRSFTSVDDLAAKLEFSDEEMKRLLKIEANRVYSSMF